MRIIPRLLIAWMLLGAVGCGGGGDAGSAGSVAPTDPSPRRPHVSATREEGEDFREARRRQDPEALDATGRVGALSDDGAGGTPWDLQVSYDRLRFDALPAVESEEALRRMFTRVRDAREWSWGAMPGVMRRIPWLYAEDGCYLRAELMSRKLSEWGYPAPRQILAFGDLAASGALSGEPVSWWFHVAPIVRVGAQPFVLDPGMEPRRPLKVEEWVSRMLPDREGAGFAICDADATHPDGQCLGGGPQWDEESLASELDAFLGLEWDALSSRLGDGAGAVLGDRPPWR